MLINQLNDRLCVYACHQYAWQIIDLWSATNLNERKSRERERECESERKWTNHKRVYTTAIKIQLKTNTQIKSLRIFTRPQKTSRLVSHTHTHTLFDRHRLDCTARIQWSRLDLAVVWTISSDFASLPADRGKMIHVSRLSSFIICFCVVTIFLCIVATNVSTFFFRCDFSDKI